MKQSITIICLAGTLAILLSINGCSVLSPSAKDLLGSTAASYHNGTNLLDYTSSKNQENFKADVTLDPTTGAVTGFHIETTATTPESAITETGKALTAAAQALSNMISQIPAIAKQAAMAGS